MKGHYFFSPKIRSLGENEIKLQLSLLRRLSIGAFNPSRAEQGNRYHFSRHPSLHPYFFDQERSWFRSHTYYAHAKKCPTQAGFPTRICGDGGSAKTGLDPFILNGFTISTTTEYSPLFRYVWSYYLSQLTYSIIRTKCAGIRVPGHRLHAHNWRRSAAGSGLTTHYLKSWGS